MCPGEEMRRRKRRWCYKDANKQPTWGAKKIEKMVQSAL
jgi:hypothetical protein